jgi:DNA-binding CsgD family transcriptional regulator
VLSPGEMRQMVADGKSLVEVAALAGVSRQYVHLVTGPQRKRGRPRSPAWQRADEVISDYYRGMTGAQFREKYGTGFSTVQALVRKHHCPMRNEHGRGGAKWVQWPSKGELRAALRRQTLAEVATGLGVATHTLWARCRKLGLTKQRARRPKVSVEQVVELHNQGLSGAAIAKQLGTYSSTVYGKLFAAGIRTARRSRLDPAEMLALQRQGLTAFDIAAKLGCLPATVTAYLANAKAAEKVAEAKLAEANS